IDDLQLQAALEKKGLWSMTNPEQLAAMREERRAERRELEKQFGPRPEERVVLNTSSLEELEKLPGIGPATARSIVDGRPYAAVEDLRRIPGVGDKLLAALKESLQVGP
ncbi:MAG: ComEA family DNA-binding protein, partial [Chthoniobacterales bacterium]